MNLYRVKAEWKDVRGKVRVRWGKLTHDDRVLARGNRDRIEAAVQRRYAIAKDDVKQYVDRWVHSLKRVIEPKRWSFTR